MLQAPHKINLFAQMAADGHDEVGYRYHGRAAEWMTSLVLLVYALTLMVPGNSLGGRAYRSVIEVGLSEASVGIPIAIVAVLRIAALYVNGSQPRRTPIIRMIGAILGAGVFSSLAMGLYWPYLTEGVYLSTGVLTYMVLALSDAFSAYRSGADVRLASQLPIGIR